MLEGRPSGGGRRAYQEKVMGLQERIGGVCQEKKIGAYTWTMCPNSEAFRMPGAKGQGGEG